MALAIRLDNLIQTGKMRDQAELARAGRVRLKQIIDRNLLCSGGNSVNRESRARRRLAPPQKKRAMLWFVN